MSATNSKTSLSFTRETFAKLSPHPFLLAHLQPSPPSSLVSRANGRNPSQFRPAHINNGSLTHAEGSAVVRIGDTTVVCGIRGEILAANKIAGNQIESSTMTGSVEPVFNEAKELDLLVPNIDLATGCSPNFLPGLPPTTLAQSLSSRIYALLHSSRLIDIEDLKIWYHPPDIRDPNQMDDISDQINDESEIKGFWTLYIDLLFISLDGNPLDAAWLAIISALRNTRLPYAYWDSDLEMVLCQNEVSKSKKIQLKGLPIATTVLIFRAKEQAHHQCHDTDFWIIVDPDAFEEKLCDESITILVDKSSGESKILGLSKLGGCIAGPKQLEEILGFAEKRWTELHDLISK